MKREIEEMLTDIKSGLVEEINVVDGIKEQMRFDAALQILVHKISPSMRYEDQVAEAVKFADKLMAELERTK